MHYSAQEVASAEPGILAPSGFGTDSSKTRGVDSKQVQSADLDELKVKKAWEIATAPAKNLPMNLVMSYMTGSSLQIIPIMMTLMLLWNPLKSIAQEVGPVFKPLKTQGNKLQIYALQAVFVVCQLMNMAIGFWKLNKMGLIPNGDADWLEWKTTGSYVETLLR